MKSTNSLAVSTKAIDPTLDALFASSVGPAQVPSKSRYSDLFPPKERNFSKKSRKAISNVDEDSVEDGDDEVLSEIDEDIEDDDDEEEEDVPSDNDEEESENSEPIEALSSPPKKDRKRKRKDAYDDLEEKYMRKVVEDTEKEDARADKRRKGEAGLVIDGATPDDSEGSEEDEVPMVHETLLEKTDGHADIEVDKANRTLFLGNISIEAISSSKAKKLLLAHLSSPLSTLDGAPKVESIRFRSTAFAGGALPKRAAYITKSLMTATTKSTNAYVVYSTPVAARVALKALNGSVVLDRHMRVDSVAHPTPVDHRRCVFVGNLGFVDDETVLNMTPEGETTTKKRTKVPADFEEGLWRTFGKQAGKVESVRIPRDPKTRVGKGFAYVQFYDVNDVESALLLNGKKFPPMLPRLMRVSRAKDPRKTALAMERNVKSKFEGSNGRDKKSKSTKHIPKVTPEQLSQAGRTGKLLGRAAAAKQRHGDKFEGRQRRDTKEVPVNENFRSPEQVIFEGRRASAKDGKPKDLKFGKTRGKKVVVKDKSKNRGARRAAEWRKGGK